MPKLPLDFSTIGAINAFLLKSLRICFCSFQQKESLAAQPIKDGVELHDVMAMKQAIYASYSDSISLYISTRMQKLSQNYSHWIQSGGSGNSNFLEF